MSVASPVIDYIDGATRRIYLLQGVTQFHPIDDIYTEYRNLRRTNESLRKWHPFLKADGNINKGGGKATPRYVTLLEGTRIVPYDENAQLIVSGECITDNPEVDSDIFYTDELTNPVKVYYAPSEAEIIFVGDQSVDTDAPTWDGIEGINNAYQNGGQIVITWGKASDANAVSYNVYISKFTTDVFSQSSLLTNVTGYMLSLDGDIVGNFEDGQTYYLGVRAMDSVGNETSNEDYVSVTYSEISTDGGLTQSEHDHLLAIPTQVTVQSIIDSLEGSINTLVGDPTPDADIADMIRSLDSGLRQVLTNITDEINDNEATIISSTGMKVTI